MKIEEAEQIIKGLTESLDIQTQRVLYLDKLVRDNHDECQRLWEKDQRTMSGIAAIISTMHKPEYAAFFIDGGKIDGHELAELIRENRIYIPE